MIRNSIEGVAQHTSNHILDVCRNNTHMPRYTNRTALPYDRTTAIKIPFQQNNARLKTTIQDRT